MRHQVAVRRQEMKMTQRAPAITAALILGLWVTPPAIAEDSPDSLADNDQVTLADLATEAGTTAGIAAICNADPAPIDSAFRDLLHASFPDHASRHTIWQRYQATKSTTIAMLNSRPAVSCDGVNMTIRNQIHQLSKPMP
jgi:hypothetical protein